LVTRFKLIRTELERLTQLAPAALVDALFPVSAEWAEELRRAALLGGLERIERSDLFERLRTHVSQPEIPEDQEHVRIMSLHKSKGLTSKVVIVISCLEALISNRSANPRPAEVAEERRLFYVALIRCKEILVLSSFSLIPRKEAYHMRMQAALVPGTGEEGGVIASQFLNQLGPERPNTVLGAQFLNKIQ
jgi:DNA helicase II / ATP-dependent DNA helicase PcrA